MFTVAKATLTTEQLAQWSALVVWLTCGKDATALTIGDSQTFWLHAHALDGRAKLGVRGNTAADSRAVCGKIFNGYAVEGLRHLSVTSVKGNELSVYRRSDEFCLEIRRPTEAYSNKPSQWLMALAMVTDVTYETPGATYEELEALEHLSPPTW